MTLNALRLTWTTPVVMFLILLPVPFWGLEMQWVPTSISIFPGEDATIPCNFHKKHNEDVNISWVLLQNPLIQTFNSSYLGEKKVAGATQNLTIRNVQKTDSGVYICRVTIGNNSHASCGTYLRLKERPVYMFFDVGEATKNRLITAEGIILLLCAIIPGTFLLYKKRLENVNSMSLKEAEGENIYEGLNLEDCSVYEDIARGLQTTYEDVGTFRVSDIHLEKP